MLLLPTKATVEEKTNNLHATLPYAPVKTTNYSRNLDSRIKRRSTDDERHTAKSRTGTGLLDHWRTCYKAEVLLLTFR